MSDQDQNKTSQNEDDELESLSADEKAAFEKIMAEIAAATGNDPSGSDTSDKKKEESATIEEPPPATETGDDDTPPSTGVVEESPSSKNSAEPEAPESEVDAETVSNDGTGADQGEDLNDEQQAALDQIMAEIESQGKGDSDKKTASPPASDAEAPPENDHQAALDQIMADIESQGGPSQEESETPDAPTASTDDDLDEDQQAALNQIMADIETKRKGEPEKKTDTSPTDSENEDLDDDQQAALDQIMAEIETKRKGEPEPEEIAAEDGQQPEESDSDDPEQEAALQNILNEINAKKSRSDKKADAGNEVDEPAGQLNSGEDESKSDASEPDDSENASLSMEEFDDALSDLISSQNSSDAKKEEKNTVKEPDPVEKEKAPPPEPAKQPAPPPTDDYPVLKEVQAGPEPDATPALKKPVKKAGGRPKRRIARLLWASAAFAGFIVLCTAGFWAYRHFFQDGSSQPMGVAQQGVLQPSESAAVVNPGQMPVAPEKTVSTDNALLESPIVSAKRAEIEPPAEKLAGLRAELVSARKQIQSKIFDIQQLKSYYERGIAEESEKIEDQMTSDRIPTFENAVNNKVIELGLRAIQRRRTYISKLDTPLAQLMAMSEELLYLERRAQTYEILNSGINGLPIERFKLDVIDTIASHLAYKTQLSIDDVEASPPPLAEIWDGLVSDLKKKTSLLAQREPLNRAISAEICKGQFERKYQLTALSAKTAQCLIKWEGKDLYLNALTDLPPATAEILSKWPGEWLSLNGVQELSAESAGYLAQWQGKRLSLNSLTALSPEATAQLSKWHGEQLEMVGLKSIGRWENYGTRLFLSEDLRRQLEAQLE